MQSILTMKKGVFFSVGFTVILVGVLLGIIVILATKESVFKQETIGSYSYKLINQFYSVELERHTLIQAGRHALLSALEKTLAVGIKKECKQHEGIAIWNDCIPTKEDVHKALQDNLRIDAYQKSSLYFPDNYELQVKSNPSSLSLFARGYALVTYNLEKKEKPTKGEANIQLLAPLIEGKTEPCPLPQRLLPKQYLAAFSQYQTSIYAAAERYKVDPAFLVAIITKETSFGTLPFADRANEYGQPYKDGIPDYLAGCRVCHIEGCLSHSTVLDPAKSDWRAPPNKPEHNVMCAAERVHTYREKINQREDFGCLKDQQYSGMSNEQVIKKIACTYNSGPEKYAYADEVYAFYLQWKDVLCQRNKITGSVIAEQRKRQAVYSVSPSFSSVLFFNLSSIERIFVQAKEFQTQCKQLTNPLLCVQKAPFFDASCKEKYKAFPPSSKPQAPDLKPPTLDSQSQTNSLNPQTSVHLIFCVPLENPLMHGKPLYLKFAWMMGEEKF